MSRAFRGIFGFSAVMLLGYGVMRAATPTDEQFYKSLSPDLRRKVDEHRGAKARADQYEKIKAASEAGEVVFQDSATGNVVGSGDRRR